MPVTLKHDEEDHSLPRSRIIRHRKWMDLAFRQGRRRSNRWLTLIVLVKTDATQGEVAFLTPKRLGAAVIRNRVRRYLREIFRTNSFRPPEGYGYVWVAKSAAATATFDDLHKAMTSLYKEA